MSSLSKRLAQMPPDQRRSTLQDLPTHLAKALQAEKLHHLLTNFHFMEAKVSALGVQPLIEDYDLVLNPDLLTFEEGVKLNVDNLKLIQDALRLSAHILEQDKTRLMAQLLGRLSPSHAPEIQSLLEQAAKLCQLNIKLCPLSPSLRRPKEPLVRTIVGHTKTVTAVAVTPDGQKIISASVDQTLRIWNLKTGEMLHTLEGNTGEITAIAAKSRMTVALTPDGHQAISVSADTIKIWDLKSITEKRAYENQMGNGLSVVLTRNEQQVISDFGIYALKIWNWKTGKIHRILQGHTNWIRGITVTQDGQKVISASADCTLKIWNLQTGKILHNLRGHTGEVTAVVLTQDGQKVISASADCTLKIWNLQTGEILHTLRGHTGEVTAVAVTQNGKQVISASDSGEIIRDNTNVLSVTVIADNQQVIFASSDNTLEVWNLNNQTKQHTFKGSTDWLRAVAVTPDGCCAICASQSIIEVWNLANGAKLHTLQGHTDVRAVAVTPDKRRAISISEQILKVWDIESGKVIDHFSGDARLWACAITSDGKTIIASEISGRMHFLQLEDV